MKMWITTWWCLVSLCFIELVQVLPLQSNDVPVSNLDESGVKPPMYDEKLFQGDILGMTSYRDRSSIVDPHHLWAGGVVYYSLGESAKNITALILEAIEEFENKTCLKFKVRPPEVIDYIKIENANGCNSLVGRVGGPQALNLGDGCHVKTIVMHEFLHAIGFHHEQSRSDRDKYVEIVWDNISNRTGFNFEMVDEYDNNLLDEEFDYTSLMMYEWNAWAINFSLPTIIPKKPGIELIATWQKEGFSAGDIRKINKLYQCFGQKRPEPPKIPDFVCDFETDYCGIKNQEDIGTNFERIYTEVGDRKENLLIVLPELVESPYTRLITPYFKVHGRHVTCFSLDYYMEGEGVLEMEITQQDDKTILVSHIEPLKPEWMHHQVTLNTTGVRDVRFFVGVTLKRGAPGVAALDNFVFSRRPC